MSNFYMNVPLDITIAIPVKNEEKNLPGCLKAIGKEFVKEIIIVDSGSTDETIQIAKAWGAEVVHFDWNGKFPKKRNWLLRHYSFKTKWILFLDADEYLTENFKRELRKILPDSKKVGYWLNYSVYFLRKQLKGGYPLKKLALFKLGFGEYEKIDEEQWSQLDMEVHEHPVLLGGVGIIRNKIDHQDFRGVSHYVKKHDDYATWEARRFLKAKSDRSVLERWTWKQRLKYKFADTILVGPVYFFVSFFLLGGIRDGARGFAFAILKMAYFTQIYSKIKEFKKN